MKKAIFTAFLILFLLPFTHLVRADFWTSDNLGNLKNSFYTNSSVYITSSNSFLTVSSTAAVYIVTDNNTWPNQTALADVTGGNKTITLNSSGGISTQSIWNSPVIGTYDVVIDVNKNGVYDSGTCGSGGDCVFSLTTYGFQVLRAPIPIISVSYGPVNPPNHNLAYDPNSPNDVKLQLQLVGDLAEDVKISDFFVSASGSGNDKEGVSAVKLYLDTNNNGIVDSGEQLIAYGTYTSDDGVAQLTFTEGTYLLSANATVNMLLIYTMSNKVVSGTTYTGQIAQITARGVSSNTIATMSTLPLNLATTTISGGVTATTTTAAQTTTTTAQTTTTTTQTTAVSTTTTTQQSSVTDIMNSPWIVVIIVAAILIPVILIIFVLRRKKTDQYETLKEKYKGF